MNRKNQFVIFNPTYPRPPRVWHVSRADAIRIAQSMARENPGETFYVMRAEGHVAYEAPPAFVDYAGAAQ
jgi:hypothetical protein